jgi:hypothetical protein
MGDHTTSGAMMGIPHYINENKSDMRGIKPGWYATDVSGKLSSGPFSSRELCLGGGTQPTNDSTSRGVKSPAEVITGPFLHPTGVEGDATEVKPGTAP